MSNIAGVSPPPTGARNKTREGLEVGSAGGCTLVEEREGMKKERTRKHGQVR